MQEYTLGELAHRSQLRSRRIDLLMETMYLAARGLPEDYTWVENLDVEIDTITSEINHRRSNEDYR